MAGNGCLFSVRKSLMTVKAAEPALGMDIWRQIVFFQPIRPLRKARLCKGRTVFIGKIMLIIPVKITPHIVAVMAAQALFFSRSHKGMAYQFAILKGKMAGRTTTAMAGIDIIISLGIHMATQATSTKHVIHQGFFIHFRWCNCNLLRPCHNLVHPKVGAGHINFLEEQKMTGMGSALCFSPMAFATGLLHVPGMCRFGKKALMGTFFVACLGITGMAICAGK